MKWIEPSVLDLLASKPKHPAEQIINKVYQLIQIRVTKWNKKQLIFTRPERFNFTVNSLPPPALFVNISKCLMCREMAAVSGDYEKGGLD
jgi:hypothetical protein